jgi:putative transposase
LLPLDGFPPWQTVYGYFRRWTRDGTWRRVHDTLRADVRRKAGRHKHPTAGCLDSQSVKTTVLAYDAGQKIQGRKRHILVDTLGLLPAAAAPSAAVQDRDGAKILLRALGGGCKKLRRVWIDGGYRGRLLEWAAGRFRFVLEVVLRSGRTQGVRAAPAPPGRRARLGLAVPLPPPGQGLRGAHPLQRSLHPYRHDQPDARKAR